MHSSTATALLLAIGLAPCCCGNSALHLAARDGNIAAAERALQSGAAVDGRDVRGDTPLGIAVTSGNLGMVRFLLDRGADADRSAHTPPLLLAERADIAALLIDRGASVDARDALGTTALMAAAYAARAEVAALLIRRGARIDARDRARATVMHHAARGNSPAVVGALIDAGALANEPDSAEQYPLHLVGERQGPPSAGIVAALLRAGNPFDAKDARGRTALCRLSAAEDTVQVLLDAGADPNADCGGDSPLYFAVAAGNLAAIDLLLGRGATLPKRGHGGERLLCRAAAAGFTDLVARLLDAGVPPNAGDEASALHHGCMHDREAVVRLLLRRGADPSKRATGGPWEGRSARNCAEDRPAMRLLFDE